MVIKRSYVKSIVERLANSEDAFWDFHVDELVERRFVGRIASDRFEWAARCYREILDVCRGIADFRIDLVVELPIVDQRPSQYCRDKACLGTILNEVDPYDYVPPSVFFQKMEANLLLRARKMSVFAVELDPVAMLGLPKATELGALRGLFLCCRCEDGFTPDYWFSAEVAGK